MKQDFLNKLIKRTKDWYEGQVEDYDDPNIIGVAVERHWTASFLHKLVDFYLKHWQWLWLLIVSIVGVYITYRFA